MARRNRKTENQPAVQHQSSTQISWSGPLPPPAALEHFDRIIPNGASRILAMAETEQTHRVAMETAALDAEIADQRRGQWLGASVAILCVLAAAFSAYHGAPWQVTVAFLGVPVLGIVKALVNGRRAAADD